MKRSLCTLLLVVGLLGTTSVLWGQKSPIITYEVSMPDPATHLYEMKLKVTGNSKDTVMLKMPGWMPGYYQFLNYGQFVKDLHAKNGKKELEISQIDVNTWKIVTGGSDFTVTYKVLAEKEFVANSYLDENRAYIVPTNNFLYTDEWLRNPVEITIDLENNPAWNKIATGLKQIKDNTYLASDFDILYDSPILVGDLEVLPSFEVQGINHRFMGYKMGEFDAEPFLKKLKGVVEAAVSIMGDIPYEEYTFIAIGPGRGGIEHLNNTTVSFDGSQLQTAEGMNRMLNFLGHEYFHHFNAKRIRPYELGPFDYSQENRTNQLWVIEGLTVYYEYIIAKMSGAITEDVFFDDFNHHINTLQNNQGRKWQTLAQSSYNTWSDGPFGTMNVEKGKTISYYNKGPVVGLLLDFAIRNATQNERSLDDVMRLLYNRYYKAEGRGFTDAELQQTCEQIAGKSLNGIFEYVFSTTELDYDTYLGYAGLRLERGMDNDIETYRLVKVENPSVLQKKILKSWLHEN
ncbi:M61 family metallopeptidase [Robertkochia solimangrovi]|uniref:M61 family metallopeptidase n=1 Tax=Robertkochia solimangrovi TaxID=2213046 RepID=UPI0013A5454E|nr:M61 family metallopeptidase [Robertkochia solimangrovi]